MYENATPTIEELRRALIRRGACIAIPFFVLAAILLAQSIWCSDCEPSLFFKPQEFLCKCGKCDGHGPMSPDLVRRLDEIRREIDQPIRITSACRCSEHNKAVGGAPHSAHLNKHGWCRAVDVECRDAKTRYLLVKAAVKRFRRVGVGPDFVHMDNDPELPQDVMWTYTKDGKVTDK